MSIRMLANSRQFSPIRLTNLMSAIVTYGNIFKKQFFPSPACLLNVPAVAGEHFRSRLQRLV
jgi:hypothetical protein